LPKGVNRSSSVTNPLAGSMSRMERNLYSVKIFPSRPGLFCAKSTGRPSLTATATATAAITGDSSTRAVAALTRSRTRLSKSYGRREDSAISAATQKAGDRVHYALALRLGQRRAAGQCQAALEQPL